MCVCVFAERAEEVPAAAQDAQRDLQQGSRDNEEAAQEVARRQQKRPRHGQRAQEHADPRGGKVQARRLLRAEPEKCMNLHPLYVFLSFFFFLPLQLLCALLCEAKNTRKEGVEESR